MLEKQIISEKSLTAVQELINFLKQNVRRRDVFHAAGHDVRVQQIANELERGGTGLRNLLDQGWVIESAAALQYFLIRLRKPLIPPHIQALALDENPGVSPEVVAQDILGLLRQDVAGRHATLVISVLDLLHCILKHSPSDELTGCNIPITMLPIFFNMQSEHILHWRRVAMVFVELIRLAPSYLNFPVDDELDDGMGMLENFDNNEQERINQAMLQQRLLEVNVVLRRYLIRPGYRGDSLGLEIFRPLQRQRQRPRRSVTY
ncbi:hypothetical protein ILUMI_10459 [Ignelater luminosus]|uniref:Rho-GAP domain-containing protein n=1 Tax=Ignelater luminosus TaxID=2038154 RepID=A0A8K0GDK7_IGNLU|nr:hypothetical protein ILUMI_10459 [Ignelater luminosus]